MGDPLFRVEGLTTRFFTEEGTVNAVHDLDLTLDQGEIFGLVGESGSGKSVTALSLIDLVASPGRVTDGTIEIHQPGLAERLGGDYADAVDNDWVDLTQVSQPVRESLRGTTMSMIFQDPESSFNPSLTVGEQLAEAVEVQRRATSRPREDLSRTPGVSYSFSEYLLSAGMRSKRFVSDESRDRAIELLEDVGIPDPVERAEEYPHEYSGGMLQRAMIAQALAGNPDLLIADEPTTALDVTIQAQILELLSTLQAETNMTILLITHNLGVVARMCDRVGVMYAGEIVERGPLSAIYDDPVHPYTQGLLGSVPSVADTTGRLEPIPGNVPSLLAHEMEERCYFADRCPKAMEACLEKPEAMAAGSNPNHEAACYLARFEYGDSPPLPAGYFEDEGDRERDERRDPR